MYNFRLRAPPIEHIRPAVATPQFAPARPYVVSGAPPAHLLRRLGAVCYDTLLLVAVLFIAGLPLPLVPEAVRFEPWVRYAMFAYLLGVSFVFFGWFWTHGGQTLGMRAWRLRVVTADGEALAWRQAWRRFVWALVSWAVLGLGFVWSLVDAQRRTWHDRASATRLVTTARPSPAPQKQHADPHEQHGR